MNRVLYKFLSNLFLYIKKKCEFYHVYMFKGHVSMNVFSFLTDKGITYWRMVY